MGRKGGMGNGNGPVCPDHNATGIALQRKCTGPPLTAAFCRLLVEHRTPYLLAGGDSPGTPQSVAGARLQ